jgi:hypothetical protein
MEQETARINSNCNYHVVAVCTKIYRVLIPFLFHVKLKFTKEINARGLYWGRPLKNERDDLLLYCHGVQKKECDLC